MYATCIRDPACICTCIDNLYHKILSVKVFNDLLVKWKRLRKNSNQWFYSFFLKRFDHSLQGNIEGLIGMQEELALLSEWSWNKK